MYHFTFASVGGATRVRIQSGEDIRHLGELDKKMWTILSCPVHDLEIDTESLNLMDTDQDGQLHVDEVIATAEWLCSVLKDPQVLFEGKARLPLDAIADESIASVARSLSQDHITLEQVDAAIAAVTIAEQPVPQAPYAANIIAAYKARQGEYAAYFEQVHLQEMGLATIAEDAAIPGMKEAEFIAWVRLSPIGRQPLPLPPMPIPLHSLMLNASMPPCANCSCSAVISPCYCVTTSLSTTSTAATHKPSSKPVHSI